ncbi:MAG TPA: TIGR00730 family Rossman fold protein [Verrucomicrobiae bacterium]|jgi:uncharacterized protein (TIGR00730 family)|nr:TIGR00730 family Rossman fold protein [Verrucomicrobiae bacterium]
MSAPGAAEIVACRSMDGLKRKFCVFTGSRPGGRREYTDAAKRLGWELVARGCALVYGGGNIGLMAVVADAVLLRGGHVIGVIPSSLVSREVAHQGLSDLRIVQSMHERKALMGELSDGFIAMPGGIGTMEEFFEVLSWAQLGLHDKPCGLLNVAGYYDGLIDFLDHALADDFLKPKHRALLIVEKEPAKLLDRFEAFLRDHPPKRFDPRPT